jgi:hypothetical protein
MAPKGLRSYWRGEYLAQLDNRAIDTFCDTGPAVCEIGRPLSQMVIFRIGQQVASVPEDTTAFSHRDANYMFHPISVWGDREDDDRIITANKDFAGQMRQFATGAVYLNFTRESDRVRDSYGEKKYNRLAEIKDKYDPQNLFHGNHNIKPIRAAGEPELV